MLCWNTTTVCENMSYCSPMYTRFNDIFSICDLKGVEGLY